LDYRTNPQATHFLNQLANDNSGSQLQQNLASCAVQPHSEKQRKSKYSDTFLGLSSLHNSHTQFLSQDIILRMIFTV